MAYIEVPSREAVLRHQAAHLVRDEMRASRMRYWSPRSFTEVHEIYVYDGKRVYVYVEDVEDMTERERCQFGTFVRESLMDYVELMQQKHVDRLTRRLREADAP